MNYFIKNIHINKLFHLENIDIPIADEKYPHLIITGKNGSGKTVLLNAIADVISNIEILDDAKLTSYDGNKNVSVEFVGKRRQENIITVFYQANRSGVKMFEPKSPTKPDYIKKGNIKETVTNQFLYFMSDLKIQEALARNEKLFDDADKINAWFVDFESLLKQIFQDEELKLEFNYKDYSFKVCTEGKKFKFTQLSDGFSAALDIVADLILKMQDDNSLTRSYLQEGIVLIDEIETHLHLELQKIIMPFLTKTFPNIQFIVTTHSPFVLSSMENAVAFDLEDKEPINDLTDYSYSSLAEGFFGVRPESSTVRQRLNELTALLSKETLSVSEKMDVKLMMDELDKIPEPVLPSIVGEYLMLKLKNAEKIKTIHAL